MEQYTSQMLLDKDAQYVWHPFTQAQTAKTPILIARGEGAYLFDYDNRGYFDANSSWWVNVHGHCHPYITEYLTKQAQQLEHTIFAGFTHQGAITLAERLVNLLGMPQGRVFFTDNGSSAVEAALKIALQYWHNKGVARTKIICFEKGYHGDTFGAMSLAGKGTFNRPFWPYLFEIIAIPPPYPGKEEITLKAFQEMISKGDVACFLFEPLIQGVSGMVLHSLQGLEALISLCLSHEIITIADEVMTGFGRVGPLFACDQLAKQPDITCLSKGLTGGFLPLGAVVCKEYIYENFLSEQREKAFLHGHSYCGNPLACAAALASLDLFALPACTAARQSIEASHRLFQRSYGDHPALKRCEVAGTILILEYKEEQPSYFSPKRDYLMNLFLQHQIIVRPLGNVLYLMPPYCTQKRDLDCFYECVKKTLEGNS